MAAAKITSVSIADGRTISEMINLETISIPDNDMVSFSDVKYSTSLVRLYLQGNDLSGTLDLTGCTSLQYLEVTSNSGITEIGFEDLNSCLEFESSGTSLNEENIDLILASLDANGITTGKCYLDVGSNAAPSVTGQGYASSLQGKFWDVLTN